MLPKDIRDIILDYYYSHKMYLIKNKVLREMRFHDFFTQIHSFYEMFHHISISYSCHTLPPEEKNNN